MTAISGSRVTIKLPLNRDHLAVASLISTKLKATADIVKKVEMEVLVLQPQTGMRPTIQQDKQAIRYG